MTGRTDPELGERFGKWTVIRAVERINSRKFVLVRCECGVERSVYVGHLNDGRSTQCRRCSGVFVRLPDDAVTYDVAHQRLRKARGKASEHECFDCGGPAQQWSYAYYGVENERTELRNGYRLRYSLSPEDYYPRCVACHVRYDIELATQVGTSPLPGDVDLAA